MIKRLFSIVLASTLLWILISKILEKKEEFYLHNWDFSLSKILPVIVLLLFFYPLIIFSWHLILRFLKIDINFATNFRIWMISNLSRLLPGSIWQYPSRVYLLSKISVPKSIAVEALILEALFNISAASLLFFGSLFFWDLPEKFIPYKKILLIFSLLPLLIFGLTNEYFVGFLIKTISKFKKLDTTSFKNFSLPWFAILILLLFFIFQLSLGGLLLFFLSRLIVENLNFSLIPAFCGIYSLSWLLGYLVVFAPGGLGVSDSVIALLLANFMPFPFSATVAITFRVLILIGELFYLVVAFLSRILNNKYRGILLKVT